MDNARGLYDKFRVERRDGSSEKGGKHFGCRYFVLDLNHDPFVWHALKVYAKKCKKEFPKLSEDLNRLILEYEVGRGLFNRDAEIAGGAR